MMSNFRSLLISQRLAIKAPPPIPSNSRIETKLKKLVEKWKAAVKRAQWKGENAVNEFWTIEHFDICSC